MKELDSTARMGDAGSVAHQARMVPQEIDMTDDNSHSKHAGREPELWPMGAVTRRTGISEHTLRAWERRFGFPTPVRLPSGHRRYTSDQVRQLLLINRALSCGYRAGDVVALPAARIEAMVRENGGGSRDEQPEGVTRQWVEEIISDALAFDEAAIRMKLVSDSAVLGVGRFLRDRAAPLIEELGLAWERGDIGVRHEHFVSEILEGRLRTLRLPFEAAVRGRPVVLGCLPDELHGLGLQMVALEIVAAGRSCVVLGPRNPIDEMVRAAAELDAVAVGLSLSAFAPEERTREQAAELAAGLPGSTALWIGGSGATRINPLPDGVTRLTTLDEVAAAVASLPD